MTTELLSFKNDIEIIKGSKMNCPHCQKLLVCNAQTSIDEICCCGFEKTYEPIQPTWQEMMDDYKKEMREELKTILKETLKEMVEKKNEK